MVKEAALVGKAMTLLELIARQSGCSIAQLTEGSGLPFSTVHRVVRTLIDRNYVVSPGRGRYALGPAVMWLSSATSMHQLLADVGRPLLAALSRRERVHVHLGVLDSEMVTYLVRCAFGRHPIASVEGAQLEAYCSAIGKVLLAYMRKKELHDYLARGDLVALTPRTITTAADLARELHHIRQCGWAMDNEEIVVGLKCVAVPVFDASGLVCAAISASGSVARLPNAAVEPLLARLRPIAAQVREKLFPVGGGR